MADDHIASQAKGDISCHVARVVAPIELSSAERAVWDAICGNDPALTSAFYSFAYTNAVAKIRPHVYVAVLECKARPVGFLPYQYGTRWQRWLKAAEPVGGDMTDYFGVVSGSQLRLDVQWLLREAGLSSVLFTHLDEAQLHRGLTGEQPEPGLRIRFPSGGEAYWEALRKADKRFVSDTERQERRLAAQVGPLHFQYQVDEPTATLHHLIEQKRQQYSSTGVEDVLSAQWKRDLLLELSSFRDPLCTGVMSILRAGDTWVASHFGLQCKDNLHYWFPVYNPALRAYAPGRLLLKKMIDASRESGTNTIDRGAGDTSAKRDFANAEHVYYRGLWARPTLRSLCFRMTCGMRWRIAVSRAGRSDKDSAASGMRKPGAA